ncbi:uncharacterized protein LOC128223114 isoform X1 [Mya arenaria]|uniref:uncharacterized protein LOC128223114 isoform X1 n=1 Tax=Mya arenaria TaxID=6604 RepID=UPI0022E38E51|nr:uncharacterized protein LOC128223114 isoform X1 [Mya arenaria]
MHNQFARSAQSTRSAERTKRCIRITAWATRILALLSIAFCIVAFVAVGDAVYGICMMITAILSVMSPLNFSCCCYSDCSRNIKTEKAIGHCSVHVLMFISNMGYIILFGYSCYFWSASRKNYGAYGDNMYYDVHSSQYRSNYYYTYPSNNIALLDTIFAFTLIITFFLSMLNLFSFCLVYKYGCCFTNEVDGDHCQKGVETAVVMNQHISTNGGLKLTNETFLDQLPFTSYGSQYPQYQPNTSGPYNMYSRPQQAIGVTSDSVGVSVQSTMATTSGQPVSPPPYLEANLNVKHSP